MAALPTVVIVGRPNVGKSTFFNRVLGKRLAIVEDVPGVTRDRNFAKAEWAGRRFYIVDTGGLELESDEPMTAAIRRQVLAAVAEADVVVMVVDGKAGLHPLDARIADLLRKSGRPVILTVNKMDRLPEETGHHEFWALGIGEPLPVSALSGKGSGEVLDAIVAALPVRPEAEPAEDELHVAVIGKPNVGKSSFINRLLGEERLVVSDVAGTTRDAIDTPMRYKGRTLVFIDTAGLRRQSRIGAGLEYFSALRTQRSVDRADVCLLLIDGSDGAHVQDLKIAEMAWNAGAGLVVAVNKWDLVEKDERTAAAYERELKRRAPTLRWVPVVFTSALTGQRLRRSLDVVLEVADQRARRIPTAEVNEVVRELAERNPPPTYRGMPVHIMYATQASTKPPTFVLFTNYAKAIPDHYVRYLQNEFRERWGFLGTPIRIRFRSRRQTT